MASKFLESARTLFPGYFAFAMATGIVSSGLNAFGFPILSHGLFAVCVVGYLALWALTLVRVTRFPRELVADFSSYKKGPGFFTTVAATAVLGATAVRVYSASGVATALLWLGAGLWILLIYGFATYLVTTSADAPAQRPINGGWLVIVVATQSLAILSGLLPDAVPLFVSVGLFMMGTATYVLLTTLIVSRLILTRVEAAELEPTHWILMGAAAISCLAGTYLDARSADWAYAVQAVPSLQAITLFFWFVATAWIPLLLLLGVWRHGVKRVPLRYEPQLWSVVFPLGMYSFATHSLSVRFGLPFLQPVSAAFLVVACAAWLWSFCGMVASHARSVLPARTKSEPANASAGGGKK